MPLTGIAFEGCAGKAAFHVGVADWMLTHKFRPAALAGSSSGAIVAAAFASGRAHTLLEAWMDVCDSRVFQPTRLLRAQWPFVMSDIVGDALRKHLGSQLFSGLEIPLAIIVTRLEKHGFRSHALTGENQLSLVDAVLASCFLPGPYSRMVPIDRHLTFDGAWLTRTPVAELRGLGATRTIACVTNTDGHLYAGFFRRRTLPAPAECRILAPIETLPIGSFDFDRERMLMTIEIGRRSAGAFFDRHADFYR